MTYSLGRVTDVKHRLTIESETGQLLTRVALDYETKSSYSVTVTATDTAQATDSIEITIDRY